MKNPFLFHPEYLQCTIGGTSVIDIPRLRIKTLDEADAFLSAYGFDLNQENDLSQAWYFYRRALVLLQERLLKEDEKIPELFQERKSIGDIRKLLVWASSNEPADRELQRWSCALLRVMHAFVHTEKDLFSTFAEEIQQQILTPFQEAIRVDEEGPLLTSKNGAQAIRLERFEAKPFKSASSTVIKVLAKSDLVAMKILDRLGIRIVAPSLLDCFRAIHLMVEDNLISFPHIIPDQSSNTIFPTDLFLRTINRILAEGITRDEEIQERLQGELEKNQEEAIFLRKENIFSGVEYRFIKFIARRLIQVETSSGKNLQFFFPFEVQVVDAKSFARNSQGEASHESYKERQREAARERVFGGASE